MKGILLIVFVSALTWCIAQQTAITSLDKKVVTGWLSGGIKAGEFISIRIQNNKRYNKSVFIYKDTLEMSKGKWQIKNDTLILTEKFYKEKYNYKTNRIPFAYRKKIRRTTVAKLILYKGKWLEIEENKYIAKMVYDQYILEGKAWKRKNAEEEASVIQSP